MSTRVLILCNYPHDRSPGQRFRFEQYYGVLKDAEIDVTVQSFFDHDMWSVLYKPGNTFRKIWGVLVGFARRFAVLRRARQFDYVFIALEAAPLGPPIIEWCLFQMGCKVIYDIDDVIFISRTSRVNWLAAPFRWRSKIAYVARRSYKVTGCNKFLADWAAQYNPNSQILPTTIDPAFYTRKKYNDSSKAPVIGWIGSRSNLPYLDIVVPALQRLRKKHDFVFRVICDFPPPVPPAVEGFEFLKWDGSREVADLEKFDIGLMPVPDNLWAKGKVGLKAIQYSAMEIVPVASDVGSGPEVIIQGKTGLLVKNTDDEWFDALDRLLTDRPSWRALGKAGRDHIMATYSVPAQTQNYINLFQPAAPTRESAFTQPG